MNDKEVTFKIVESLGVISDAARGWKKELNLVSWNDRDAKLDIRDWSEDHQKMGKGVTLTRDEGAKLKELLAAYIKA